MADCKTSEYAKGLKRAHAIIKEQHSALADGLADASPEDKDRIFWRAQTMFDLANRILAEAVEVPEK